MGKQQQNDILSRIEEQIEFYEGRMQMLYVFFFEDVKKEIERFQARVKELEAINLGLTKTLVEMEAENAELRKESKKDLHTLIKAAWYLHTGQSARQVIDFIRCRLAFKTKQQADDEGGSVMTSFYSPCKCGKFEEKKSSADFGYGDLRPQTVCKNCGRHEPREER